MTDDCPPDPRTVPLIILNLFVIGWELALG